MRGFTAFAETAEPKEVMALLVDYHGALGPLVHHFEGTLDRFSGDGMIGVGIAQGFATMGRIGFEGRYGYSAIATVSNLAARFCAEAKDGQILLSQRVATAIAQLVQLAPVGELSLKGLTRPVHAYDVVRLNA
jgi:adenylate cyclase